MVGLGLEGRVVRREADGHRMSSFGENWTVLSADGEVKARDCRVPFAAENQMRLGSVRERVSIY